MDSLSEKKILEALDVVEYLTIPQVARLFYGVRRDGEPARGGQARPSKASTKKYPLEPGYWSAKWMLNAMTRKKVLVRGREKPLLVKYKSDNKARLDLYHRPGARLRQDEDILYGHDMGVVVSYVLLETSGQLVGFQRFWDDEQRKYFGEQFDLWPDGVIALKPNPDHRIILEMDGGTEWEKSQIIEKCEAWVAYAKAHPGERFTVAFPTKGAYGEPDSRRLEKLLGVFAGLRRGNMFLATTWSEFVGDLKRMDGNPLAPIFRSPWVSPDNPLDPHAISLLDVR